MKKKRNDGKLNIKMGFVTYVLGKLLYPILFTSGATIFAFRLGNELPIAARRAGR
jgi:hypothetical protein